MVLLESCVYSPPFPPNTAALKFHDKYPPAPPFRFTMTAQTSYDRLCARECLAPPFHRRAPLFYDPPTTGDSTSSAQGRSSLFAFRPFSSFISIVLPPFLLFYLPEPLPIVVPRIPFTRSCRSSSPRLDTHSRCLRLKLPAGRALAQSVISPPFFLSFSINRLTPSLVRLHRF